MESLARLATSTITSIEQSEKVLRDIVAANSCTPRDAGATGSQQHVPGSESQPVNSLALAGDCATLIRAHSTKISLLIITEPYTPSAVAKVLEELANGPIPSLISACHLCQPSRHSRIIQRDLAWLAVRTICKFRELVEQLPKDGQALRQGPSSFPAAGGDRNKSVATTGLLWSACDELMAFSKLGVAGNLIKKVQQSRDTLKDVVEELQDWNEGADEECNGSDGAVEDANDATILLESPECTATDRAQALLSKLMGSQRHIPKNDPDDLRDRLEASAKTLNLIIMLYQAIIKRRLKTLPPLPPAASSHSSNVVTRLDDAMTVLQRLPDTSGNLAQAFYDLDRQGVDRHLHECSADAILVSDILAVSWDGRNDEFTECTTKLKRQINHD